MVQFHLYVESKKVTKIMEKEIRLMVTKVGYRGCENWRKVVKTVQTPHYKVNKY